MSSVEQKARGVADRITRVIERGPETWCIGDVWQLLHDAKDALTTAQQPVGAVEYQSQVSDKDTGKVVYPWARCPKAAYDAVSGQPHEGSRLRVEYRILCTAPPSAPVVERVTSAVVAWATLPGDLPAAPEDVAELRGVIAAAVDAQP